MNLESRIVEGSYRFKLYKASYPGKNDKYATNIKLGIIKYINDDDDDDDDICELLQSVRRLR